jgi:hypothetical protein
MFYLFVAPLTFKKLSQITYLNLLYRVIEKSRNPFLTYVLFVKKLITFKSEKKKNVILSDVNVTAFSDACIQSFPNF